MKKLTLPLILTLMSLLSLSCQKEDSSTKKILSPTAQLALPGKFSVGNGDSGPIQVQFASGNLIYNVESKKWSFFEHQYDCESSCGLEKVSQLTWGYDVNWPPRPGSDQYLPTHSPYLDNLIYDKPSSEGGDDWGVAFCESNNIAIGTWRTLTREECIYLFNTRKVNGGSGEGKSYSNNITYGNIKGVVLYPDDYKGAVLSGTVSTLPTGVVFLPAAGYRYSSKLIEFGTFGAYWLSTSGFDDAAFSINFNKDGVIPEFIDVRMLGFSVRLVSDCK